jgi:hypothetical protein
MKDVVRLQVEINREQMDELEEIRELGGLRTKKELWDNAFTLLKWAAKEEAKGASIFSVNEDDGSYKELEMPFLERYAASVRKMNPEPQSTASSQNGNGNRTAATKLTSFAKKRISA